MCSRRAEDRRRNRIQEVEADNADRANEDSERAAKRLRASPEPGDSAPGWLNTQPYVETHPQWRTTVQCPAALILHVDDFRSGTA